MALTRDFKTTIMARAQSDIKFRKAMLQEALSEFLIGDVAVAKAMLRDYINATISFETLAENLHKNSKNIQRMLGPHGNPTTKSLLSILRTIQDKEGFTLTIKVK